MDRKGFTLIELLLVVVIIGIIAAIALPKFGHTKSHAAIATMQADLRNLATVQEAYFMDHNAYAPAIGDVTLPPYAYRYSGQSAVTLTSGSATSWSASVSSPQVAPVTCSVSYHTGASDDGIPVCS